MSVQPTALTTASGTRTTRHATVRPRGRRRVAARLDVHRLDRRRRRAKRVLDVVVASLAVVGLAPLMLLIAIAVAAHDRGPVLFRQTRVGMNGELFDMLKFRSMTVDAESQRAMLLAQNEADGPLFKIRLDPRVTRVGRWLRRHSLDELPQLFNVLQGTMSLVGPRPALPSEMADWDDVAHRRLQVKPGVTGAWQVQGRSDLTWQQGIRLDVEYAGHWSVGGDIVLLARTVRVVALSIGGY